MKGIIVFNVDVGQASLDTVERIVKQKKDEYKDLIKKLADDSWESLVLTNRVGNNSVQVQQLAYQVV